MAQNEASSAPLREGTTPIQASDSYYQSAAEAVETRIQERGVKSAKNIILFVGDGMSIPTITAARIYAGQQRGLDGESYTLAMDTLRTTESIFELAERSGLATGLVSTARLTHATPASTFAKTPSRDWEADSDLKGGDAGDCKDIARQFIEWSEGDGFEVAMAGGRAPFTTTEQSDAEDANRTGSRTDGRDLTAEWTAKSADHVYVTDKAGFEAIDFASNAKVLGLFEGSHMKFALDRDEDPAGEPSLVDLTKAAITRLSQDEDGFVLMVEGGRQCRPSPVGNR